MGWTKKDYEMVARIINGRLVATKGKGWCCEDRMREIADDFSVVFRENPRFDKGKFMSACGV